MVSSSGYPKEEIVEIVRPKISGRLERLRLRLKGFLILMKIVCIGDGFDTVIY